MNRKITLITGGILMVFASVFIYSCAKKFDQVIPNSVPDNILEAAQSWHSQQTHAARTLSNGKKGGILEPQWKEAQLHQSQSFTEIITPSPSFPLDSKSEMDVVRKFVFKVNGDEVTDGNIIEIYGTANSMKDKKADLFEKYRGGNMAGFTGQVITYDINYKYIKSEIYQAGAKTDGEALVTFNHGRRTSGKANSGKTITTLDDCYEAWLEWTYYGVYYEMYLYTFCYGTGGSEYGGGEPPTGGGGGCSLSVRDGVRCANPTNPNPIPLLDLTDLLDPCRSSILTALKSGDGSIAAMLTQISAATNTIEDKPNFDIKYEMVPTIPPDPNYPNNITVAHATSYFYQAGPDIFSAKVQLASNVASTASNVFIAEVLAHETMHVYMESMLERFGHSTKTTEQLRQMPYPELFDDYVNMIAGRNSATLRAIGNDPQFDHQYMANRAIEALAQSIANFDHGAQSYEYYWMLAWSGLQQSNTWKHYEQNPVQNDSQTQGYAFAMTNNRIQKIKKTLEAERTGQTVGGVAPKGKLPSSTNCYQ